MFLPRPRLLRTGDQGKDARGLECFTSRIQKKSSEKFVAKNKQQICECRSAAAAIITRNCSHKQHHHCLHPRHIALLQCNKIH